MGLMIAGEHEWAAMSRGNTAKEMDARIKDLVRQVRGDAANNVTVRYVEPKARSMTTNGKKPGLRLNNDRTQTADNEARGFIIEFMDSRVGEWMDSKTISQTTRIERETVTRIIRKLVATGVVEARGATNRREYRRRAS